MFIPARNITGLPIFTNTEYIYRETGWERLEERRTRKKLQLLYNIQNGSTPSYLLDLIPPTLITFLLYINRKSRMMHCSEAVLELYLVF
jgi:hypothetical protein